MERPTPAEMEAGVQQRPPLKLGLVFGRTFDDKPLIEAAEQAHQSVADDLRKMAEAERRAASAVDSGSRARSATGAARPAVATPGQAPRAVGKP